MSRWHRSRRNRGFKTWQANVVSLIIVGPALLVYFLFGPVLGPTASFILLLIFIATGSILGYLVDRKLLAKAPGNSTVISGSPAQPFMAPSRVQLRDDPTTFSRQQENTDLGYVTGSTPAVMANTSSKRYKHQEEERHIDSDFFRASGEAEGPSLDPAVADLPPPDEDARICSSCGSFMKKETHVNRWRCPSCNKWER